MPIELLVLALLSAFWPTLIVIDVLAFQTARPVRILLAFLAGGLLTTVTVGTLLVVAFEGTDLGSRSGTSSTDAVLDFILAGLAFLLAVVLQRRPERQRKPRSEPKGEPSFTAKMIDRGAPLAFAGAIVLNLFPGVFPLVALKDITEQHYSTARVIATLLVFYVVMFVFVEAPIVAFLCARDWTAGEVARFNVWLRANQKRIAVWALVAGGCYLTARGIYAIVT